MFSPSQIWHTGLFLSRVWIGDKGYIVSVEGIYALGRQELVEWNGWNSGISGMDIFTMYNIQQNGSIPNIAIIYLSKKLFSMYTS